MKPLIKIVFHLLSILLLVNSPSYAFEVNTSVTEIVSAYRQMIVLFDDEEQLSDEDQDLLFAVGQLIYHENLDRFQALQEELENDSNRTTAKKGAVPFTERFLEILENDSGLWDADKLAFKGVLDALLDVFEESGTLSPRQQVLKKRIQDDLDSLASIQQHYDAEIGELFARFESRAFEPRRESWEHYIDFLHSLFSRKEILALYEQYGPFSPEYRGEGKKEERHEMFGRTLPQKTIVLTFDDGPHPRYTKKILAILEKYKVDAVFFQIGQQIGRLNEDGTIKLTKSGAVSKQIAGPGSTLANHTYTHSSLPKLKETTVAEELKKTNQLLQHVSGKKPLLFRPPYGARNTQVLSKVKAEKLQSIMWNIDSRDWADPVPKSIAKRVLKTVDKEKRGIMLFHDIQPQTIEALPLILDALQKRGYQFASWNGQTFVVDKKLMPDTPQLQLYRKSWAVVIGIDRYTHWPELRYAVNDAKGIKKVLVSKFGFYEDHIFTLFDEEATQKNILTLLNDTLADPNLMEEDDRLFVFYAGHGATRRLASGRDLGYIIPVDAETTHYYGQAVSMTHFRDISEALPAKHLFFVMDSCYSGLGLVRGGGVPGDVTHYIQDTSQRIARQMLTAGGADQQVADSGPNGHSIFTWTFLQSLQGEGDLNKDGYITASELAAHIAPVVSSISLQTPAFGNLVGSAGGDFSFTLDQEPEFLNELSDQLDDQALQLQAEIEKFRDEITEKRERNLQLKQELRAVKQSLEQLKDERENAGTSEQELSSRQLNDLGLQRYQEKKYAEAAEHFVKAATLDPTHKEAMNNAGFVYYRLERYYLVKKGNCPRSRTRCGLDECRRFLR